MKISISNVSFEYASTVLEDITFKVDSGSFLGIIGSNGSGKTTLLKIIGKTLKPSAGEVFINERKIDSMSNKEAAKIIGSVSQESGSYPFTVYEIVLMGRTPHLSMFRKETDKDFKIAENAMRLTDTWKFKDKLITELSGGERQKVVIARVLAQEPKVLLLDEPTAHLDINHQIEILDLVRGLKKEGITIISVFHDLNMAAKYCDSLILLKEGKIMGAGAPEVVLTRENIKKVFMVDVSVNRSHLSDSIYIIPYNAGAHNRGDKNGKDNKKIHVIGGGGEASEIMHTLFNEGCFVTAGVLNAGDTDYDTAKSLGIDVVSESPFSPITAENNRKNIEYIKNSDFVVVENICVGMGNLKNLSACLRAECPVIIIEKTPIEKRDFTGGEALKIYNTLKEKAVVVKNISECLNIIRKFI